MKKILSILATSLMISWIHGQELSFTELASLPEPVTNNAVCTFVQGDKVELYSFCGIDATKDCGATHLKTFHLDLTLGEEAVWNPLDDAPDPLGGKIGVGASQIDSIIYVIGGYVVNNNCSEVSSRRVHRFDPYQNQFLEDAAPLPTAIDDHVQAVYQNRYIYVITGWSNNTNVTDVQVYDAQTDVWAEATSVPNNAQWRVFGGSGVIVGNNIYYAGGASFTCSTISCFPPTQTLRIGEINPDDPLDITWTGLESEEAVGYRMGALVWESQPVWLGGSQLTYNFDGIDYNGTGGVEPNGTMRWYDPALDLWQITENVSPAIMDFRGIGLVEGVSDDLDGYYMAGGMIANQEVSTQCYRLQIDRVSSVVDSQEASFSVFPTIGSDLFFLESKKRIVQANVYDINGNIICDYQSDLLTEFDLSSAASGTYIIKVLFQDGTKSSQKVIKIYE